VGFLSKYKETKKVDLGDGFYVDVKKYLTARERTAAEKKLINASMVTEKGKQGNLITQVDAGEYRLELANQAIADWNLTDEMDMPLSLIPPFRLQSIERLPTQIVDQIVAVIDDVGAEKTPEEEKEAAEEKAQFPLVIDASTQEQQSGPMGAD
jgi:hypothetical protein